jgi:Ni/Co efflux regulator RcnB
MKKLVFIALAVATVIPSAAMAAPFDRHAVVIDRKGPERIAIGGHVDQGFIARHEVIDHPGRFHLARAGHDARWLRVRDDAVLVNLHSGRILNIVDRVFR